YPRLAKLEEEGLVTKTIDGRTTIYSITDAGRAELAEREGDLDDIKSDLADSVRLIADSVRSSVKDAMRSLRADLASAAQEMRADAKTNAGASARAANASATSSREQVHRAEAIVNTFRGQVRTDVRTHVARGGMLE